VLHEEEFQEWLQHPVTEALRAWARREKESFKEQWASGAFTDQGQFATAILNAKAIGNCEALERVANIEFDQLKEEDNAD
jgi:hypothetical protein